MFTLIATIALALPQVPDEVDPRQILWQRSLADARSLSAVDGRPLLVAINADGESASERIVVERYRDPGFVEWTRSFHCVIGSWFRHTPRDHDQQGRRIECPRLGEVTCGEHIALEPLLHDAYLMGETIVVDDGVVQRISPRHALVTSAGTKEWDLFLLFDFRRLDEALAQAAARFPLTGASAWSTEIELDPSHRARLVREEAAGVAVNTDSWLFGVLQRPWVDRGIDEELRRALGRLDTSRSVVRGALYDLGAAAGRAPAIGWALRERLNDPLVNDPRAVALALPALVELAWDDASQRTFALSHAVLSNAETAAVARAAIARRSPLAQLPPAFDVRPRLAAREAAGIEPQYAAKPRPELAAAAELERALEVADDQLARDRSNSDAQLALGRAALMLARRRMQDNGPGIGLLLEDAKLALARAQEARPDDVLLLLDRARVANYLSDFAEQERLALAALAARKADLAAVELDDDLTEAARWLGDACARRLGERAIGDPTEAALAQRNGALALTQAAFGREHDATDWLSLASFYGALGRSQERLELVFAGLLQFPVDGPLRNELASACWAVGRPELLVARSEELATRFAERGWPELDWYVGFARVLEAEWARRGSKSDDALASYALAEARFRRAADSPFRDSCQHYLALCALGRGFAQLTAGRRVEAAACIVEAARLRPQVFGVRDGLEREAVDLIDGVLEWRTSGASPVDAFAFTSDLIGAAGSDARWPSAVSDAELREALRAFGRDDPDEGFRYLRASGAAAHEAYQLDASDVCARAWAQVQTIWAEQLLARSAASSRDEIEGWLAGATRLLGVDPPAAGASVEELGAVAALLRSRLGAARSVFRPGR
jgi:hypothetical protein